MHNYNYSSSRAPSRVGMDVSPKENPLDTVSCLIWNPYSNNPEFMTASWDGFIRYYTVYIPNSSSTFEVQRGWEMFLNHPVLCCDIHQDHIAFAGLANGDILCVNMPDNQVMLLGKHEAPISGVFWIREKNCVMSVGIDNMVKFWTLQSNNNSFLQH